MRRVFMLLAVSLPLVLLWHIDGLSFPRTASMTAPTLLPVASHMSDATADTLSFLADGAHVGGATLRLAALGRGDNYDGARHRNAHG